MNEILLADDEPNQIELMKFNLEKNGFLVKSAYNGEQALDMIYEKKPTVLIADWMMPKMSGIKLCKILRSNKNTKLFYLASILSGIAISLRISGIIFIFAGRIGIP